ncbi:uncharacterized protein TNIN_303541 [Trichonephila inaurata madagascariensis]|uniref:Uncharacterized protein n=1 Tax=Trichonephila inaurata madagascariensis TaxID=2747483 RepID=A0A8X6XNN2_9ARAC|nr:uncharacterized protein TNIN_303541 [Trichonephila inaurata madagascariensis]
MPKNPWNYRKRKRSKKNKSKEKETYESDAAIIEQCRAVDRISEESAFSESMKTEIQTKCEDVTFRNSTTLFRASSNERNNPVAKKIKIEPSNSVVPETGPELITDETPNKNIKKEMPPSIQKNTDNTVKESSENTEKVSDVIEIAVEKPKVEVIDLTDETTDAASMCTETIISADKFSYSEKSFNTVNTMGQSDNTVRVKTEKDTVSANLEHTSIVSSNDSNVHEKSCDEISTMCQSDDNVRVKTEQNIVSANLEHPSIVSSNNSSNDHASKNSNVSEKSCDEISTMCQSDDNVRVKTEQNIVSANLEHPSIVSSNNSSNDHASKNSNVSEKSCDEISTMCQSDNNVRVKTEQNIASANLEHPSIVSSNDSNVREKSCDETSTMCQSDDIVRGKTERNIVSANLEHPSIVSINNSSDDHASKNSNVLEKPCEEISTMCQSDDIVRAKTEQNIASASHELSSTVSSSNDLNEILAWKKSIFYVESSISRVNSTAGNPPYNNKAPFSAPLLSYVKKSSLLEEISGLKLLLNKIVDKQKKNENLQGNPETEPTVTFDSSYFLERVESPILNFEEKSLDQENIEYLTPEKSTPNKSLQLNALSSNSSRMLGTRKSDLNSFSSVEPDSKKARYDPLHSLVSNLSDASQNIENMISISNDKVDLNSVSRFDSSIEIGDLSGKYSLGSDNIGVKSSSTTEQSFMEAPKINKLIQEQMNFSKLELLNIINNVKGTDSSGIVSLNSNRLSSVNIKSSADGKSNYVAAISQNTLSKEASVNRNNKKVLATTPQDDRYENPFKRTKLEEISSKVKKLNLEEYRKKKQKNGRDPRVKASTLSAHNISNSCTNFLIESYSPLNAEVLTSLNTFSNECIQSFSTTSSGSSDFPMPDANLTFETSTIRCDLQTPNSVTAMISNNQAQNLTSINFHQSNFPEINSLTLENTDYLKLILNPTYDAHSTGNTGIPGTTDNFNTSHSTLSTPLSSSYFLQNQDSRQSIQQFSNSARHENKVTNRKVLLPTPRFPDNTMLCNSHSQISGSLINMPLEDKTGRVIDPRTSNISTSFISSFQNVHLTRVDDHLFDTSSLRLPSTPESLTSNSPSDAPKRIPDLELNPLLPYNLKRDIGERYISTNDLYLIIIEWNIDDILSSHDKAIESIKFSHVRNVYDSALQYYNTYFPLLLQECWHRLYVSLKRFDKREQRFDFFCKINDYEPKKHYVSVTCDCVFHVSNVDNIPKDGNVILVQFASRPFGSLKMLGYVYFSATRVYSHGHDHNHETKKFVSTNDHKRLMKMKLSFYIVFNGSAIDDLQLIQIMRLTNIKKILMQNEALKGLSKSCLRDSILNPLHHSIRAITLPKRLDPTDMKTVIEDMFRSLNHDIPQLVLLKASENTDTYLAVMQLVDVIQKTNKSGKILLCVRQELLNDMGRNLLQSFKNVIIINREREKLSEELSSRVFDLMVSNLQCDGNTAKAQVFKESNVVLAATGACFYEDIQCLSKDLLYCIVHDAHFFPEPEAILPLNYRVRHLFLIGNPSPSDKYINVHSKAAIGYGYDKSLFNRIHNMT